MHQCIIWLKFSYRKTLRKVEITDHTQNIKIKKHVNIEFLIEWYQLVYDNGH